MFLTRAQGTVEYLVIIGVIIVLSLVAVGFVLTAGDQVGSVNSSSSKISSWTNAISVTEAAVNSDGNYYLKIINNNPDFVTVSNVSLGDVNQNFSQDLFFADAKGFVIESSDVCGSGDIATKDVIVTYITKDGLTKKEVYPAKVTFDCTNYNLAQANLANVCPSCGDVCSGGSQSLVDSSTTVAAGCYTETALETVDTDLVSANIKSGTSLFGLTGTFNGSGWTSGMTACYNSSDTSGISCGGTDFPNQDGDYSSAKNFTYSYNSMVGLDNETGLMWQKALGENANWQNVLKYCYNLVLCDDNTFQGSSGAAGSCTGHGTLVYDDWRLPNIMESMSSVDFSQSNPFSSPSMFSGYSNLYFWTSTTNFSSSARAYYLFLSSASANISIAYDNKSTSYRAHCVRTN